MQLSRRKEVLAVLLLPNIILALVLLILGGICEVSETPPSLGVRIFLGIFWVFNMLGICAYLTLFKRVGGWMVIIVAGFIAFGMLLPKEIVGTSPQKVATATATDFSEVWNFMIKADIFPSLSIKEDLFHWLRGLGRFDPYETGQLVSFSLCGFVLGVCFLFPIYPVRMGRVDGLDRAGIFRYGITFIILLLGAGCWAALQELMQILSPTREVVIFGAIESLIGLFLGLAFFVLLNVVYVNWKKALEDRRFNVLGVGIDAVNMGDCIDLFEELISLMPTADSQQSDTTNHQPSTINLSSGLRTKLPAMTTAMGVAGIVESRRNQKLQRILNESVLNTPDGMPLVWLGKLFGYRNIERVYGPDLLRDVCAYGADKGWRHFFYGAAPGIVEKLKEVLEEKHPTIEISGIYCPPFRPLTEEEETEVVETVNSSKTDILWIGISTPKQLYFMDQIRGKLNCKIICPVGYAFDVNAGAEKDAPDWVKYAGLQWVHRGIKQHRLWKRYLPDNPMFVLKVFAQLFHLKTFPMFRHERPVAPYTDAEGYPRFPAGKVSLSAMTLHGARDRVANWIETGQHHYVNICTADTVVQCYDRPDMAKIVMEAGMATTDGMPLVWLAKHFGFKDATRVYGPDLMLSLCELSEEKAYTHYFYGATDKVLAQLRNNLLKEFPKLRIAGMYSPPFRPLTDEEKDEVAERINAVNPDFVWCGLGTPKQDYWVAEYRLRLKATAILAVGAAFDFHAGHIRQAPRWMMRSGLEWFFRLCLEPRRLWRRYIIGNPRFIVQTLMQWLRARKTRSSRIPGQPDGMGNARATVARTNVIGVGVCALNLAEAVKTLIAARGRGDKGYVCVTGVHGVIESQRDPELKRIHNHSLLTVPDGMPTVWMGREQGFTTMGRVYGPDLMRNVCEASAGLFTHFLYGATTETLEKLKTNLEERFPGIQIVGSYAPPFRPLNDTEEEELQQMVAACKPDFFWVGLSTPKQEKFMASHSPAAHGGSVDRCSMIVDKEKPRAQQLINSSTDSGIKRYPLDAGIMLGVGAAFDIHAGLLKDAPEWVKNSGLQWLYRLCQEPRRLWRRYLDIVPTYLWLAAMQLLGIKRYSLED